MKTFLLVLQMVVSVLFVLSVLVQQKGSGLSGAIGGQAGGTVRSTKRGAEKLISQISVVLAVIFVILSLSFVFVP